MIIKVFRCLWAVKKMFLLQKKIRLSWPKKGQLTPVEESVFDIDDDKGLGGSGIGDEVRAASRERSRSANSFA